jgi:hypothetical protein
MKLYVSSIDYFMYFTALCFGGANAPAHGQMSLLSPESGSHLFDRVHLLLSILMNRRRRALSLSRNRLHVFANDFIVAGFGIQIISANDEHVARITEREHRFVREANADVDDSV